MKNLLKARWLSSALFLILLFAITGIAAPDFLKYDNIISCFNTATMYTLLAVGIAFVIMTGEIDVSIGATLGLTAGMTGLIAQQGGGVPKMLLFVLVTGAFIGLVNGTSTRDLDLNVTLGFRVAEPTIEPAASASSRDKHTVTWTASYHTEWPHTPDQPPEEPEEPETPETPETPVAPAVPGYDVPKTGDASGLYYVLAIFSALGLALVTCAGRKRRTA